MSILEGQRQRLPSGGGLLCHRNSDTDVRYDLQPADPRRELGQHLHSTLIAFCNDGFGRELLAALGAVLGKCIRAAGGPLAEPAPMNRLHPLKKMGDRAAGIVNAILTLRMSY